MNRDGRKSEITLKDHGVNAFQASLLLIPVVGSSLERLLFGTLSEKRSQRIERTLEEIGKKLEEVGAKPTIDDNEDLANLLETVLPPLAKANNENRRQRLRDLVFNAMRVESGDPCWSEATIAANLLASIDDKGLEILSIYYKCSTTSGSNCCAIVPHKKKENTWILGSESGEDSFSKANPFNLEFRRYVISGDYSIIRYSLGVLDKLEIMNFKDMHTWFSTVGDGHYFETLMTWVMSESFEEGSIEHPEDESL